MSKSAEDGHGGRPRQQDYKGSGRDDRQPTAGHSRSCCAPPMTASPRCSGAVAVRTPSWRASRLGAGGRYDGTLQLSLGRHARGADRAHVDGHKVGAGTDAERRRVPTAECVLTRRHDHPNSDQLGVRLKRHRPDGFRSASLRSLNGRWTGAASCRRRVSLIRAGWQPQDGTFGVSGSRHHQTARAA